MLGKYVSANGTRVDMVGVASMSLWIGTTVGT